jgi:poly-gamma-glutamate synthesis protein (capsule biosynthesis protein)
MSLGRSIIDAGATVVLGHHPHVARPVERYKSGVIAYSLGNFIGDMVWYAPFLRGSLLRCGLADHAATDPIVTPTRLDAGYRPTLDIAASEAPTAEGSVRGLDGDAYAAAIRRTMADQRRASYRAALLNLRRTPLPILVQLVTQTLRNKIAAASGRAGS